MTELTHTEAAFRASLEDVIAFLEAIAPGCKNINEALDIARLGTINDGQLRVLMQAVNPNGKRA